MNHQLLNEGKPKLVFFQYAYSANLPMFVLLHREYQVKCLSEFFDLTVIRHDCDFQRICDEQEPDLALFEMLSGSDAVAARRLKITNASHNPQLPKLAFLNADAWCEARAGFLSDMERLGIETAFSVSAKALEHMPGLEGKLFVWPNSVDPEICHDYGQIKSIPVFLSGATSANYPWRKRIFRTLSEHYPSVVCPHGGYEKRSSTGRMLYGEPYAAALNSCWFAPTCGTVANDVLRKHFEIPACKACLVTERSDALSEAGFIDMENCVFADHEDVLEKLDYLFANQEQLQRIINAGHDLVHARHTFRQRGQILQWLKLSNRLKPGERVGQRGLFEPLAVEDSSSSKDSTIRVTGEHLRLLRDGDVLLYQGNHAGAEVLYKRASNYIPWMPEPIFRIALCRLYSGDPRRAFTSVRQLSRNVLESYGSVDPDPIEWAYVIVSLLCMGRINAAAKHASRFPHLRHTELDRARWAVQALKGGCAPFKEVDVGPIRYSIHELPHRTMTEWIAQLCRMLYASKQEASAKRLEMPSFSNGPKSPMSGDGLAQNPPETAHAVSGDGFLNNLWQFTCKPYLRTRWARSMPRKLIFRIKRDLRGWSHRLESKYGYFLPYRLSAMRNDEFYRDIRKIIRESSIQTALLIGAEPGQGSAEAFLAGATESESAPLVFSIGMSDQGFGKLRKGLERQIRILCYWIDPSSPEAVAAMLDDRLAAIKQEHQVRAFDVVLINNSMLDPKVPLGRGMREILEGAALVVLDNITADLNYRAHGELLANRNFSLLSRDPRLREGYAIFKREESSYEAYRGHPATIFE